MRDMQRDFDSVGIRGNLYQFSGKADQYKIFIFVRVRSCGGLLFTYSCALA